MPTTPPTGKEIQLRGDSILQLPFVPPASLYGARLDDLVDVDASDTTDGKVLTRQADGTFALEAVSGGGGGGGVTDPELLAIAGLVSAADRLPYFTGSGTAALATFTAFARSLVDDADAATARATLGLVIGTDVQAQDAELSAIAGLTSAADRLPYFTGAGTAALATFTAFGRSLVDDADAATARATLGLVIGTDVQAQDAELSAIAGLVSAADRLPYFTGAGTAALATFTTFGRSLVDDADATTARATLGLVIGTNVQAQDAELQAIAGLTSAADTLPYFTGSGTAALATFTAAGRSMAGAATAAAQTALLSNFVGDAGSGGTKGLVPAPAAGDAAAGRYLRADGTWTTPPGGGVTDPELLAIAGLVSAADTLPYFTGSGTAALATFTAFGRSLVDDADAATARATLGLVIGTNVQAQDAELSAIAGLVSAADRLPYFTGAGTATLATFTAFGRSLVDDADATTARATLGLVIGTNVQAQDAELQAIAGLTSAADTLPYFTGSGTAALATFTAAGRSMAGAATAAAQTALLSNFVGDAGSGGTKGLVPAPAAGDAAAGRYLRADGTWTTPPGGGGASWGSITGTLSSQTDLQTALNGKQNTDAELSAIAGLTSAADTVPYFTGSGTAALATFTGPGRSMAGAASFAAQTALLSSFVGDAGSGGTKGLVPAPAAGDASRFLQGNGSWANVAAQMPRARSGVFYGAQDPTTFAQTLALVTDTFYLVPFRMDSDVTWNEIYTIVSTGGPGSCRLGIYSGGLTSDTFTLLRDAGTVAVGTTGTKSITAINTTVARGTLIWLCLLPGADFTVTACTTGSLRAPLLTGCTAANSGSVVALSQFVSGASASALPSSLSLGSPVLVTGNCPIIGLRF